MTRSQNSPLIETQDVSKSFGTVRALDEISFALGYQEILGLVGDNAAGKSTLLKTLAGVHKPDGGRIFMEGEEVSIRSPMDSRTLGIEIIYQDFMLAPNLDVVKNIFLGRELTSWRGMRKLKKREMEENAHKVLKELEFTAPVRTRVSNLSGGQQQVVAIARSLLYTPKIILMDEPTASLSVTAIRRFLELVKTLKQQQECSIIYVSHRLPDVLSVADRIMVLRKGDIVAEKLKNDTDLEEIVHFMMGTAEV